MKRVVLWLGSIAFFMFLSLWFFLGVIAPWLEYQSDTDPGATALAMTSGRSTGRNTDLSR